MALWIRQRKKYVSHYVLTCSFMVRRDGYWQRNLLYFTFIWQAKKSKWLLPGKKLLCWLHRIGLNKSFLISNSSMQQQKQSVCLRNIWSALWSSKSYIYRVEWFDWSPDNPFFLEEKWGKKILFLLHCIWRHDKRKSAFSTKYMELLPISSCKPNHSGNMVFYTII